jgi:hypothetical protein
MPSFFAYWVGQTAPDQRVGKQIHFASVPSENAHIAPSVAFARTLQGVNVQ